MPRYFMKPFSRHQKFSSVIPNRFYSTFDLGLAFNSLTSLLVRPNYLKFYLANSKLGFNFSFSFETFNSLEALTISLMMQQPCWTLDSWSFKKDVLLDVSNKKLFFKTEDRLEHALKKFWLWHWLLRDDLYCVDLVICFRCYKKYPQNVWNSPSTHVFQHLSVQLSGSRIWFLSQALLN